jgi:prepilin-type processing-associated H-X9-DG protein
MSNPNLNMLLMLLGSWILKATVILALASLANYTLKRGSAAQRHLVWLVALGTVVLVPLLSLVLPGWQIRHASPIVTNPPALQHVTEHLSLPADPESNTASGPSRVPDSLPRSGFTIQWSAIALLLWAVGTTILCIRYGISLLLLQRDARLNCWRVRDPGTMALFAECMQVTGVVTPVALLTGNPSMPITWGYWRPAVVLPAGAEQWSELRSVFLHELAHVRRGDWLALLFCNFTCALMWFNPLVWHAARALRIESEQAADDQVIGAGIRSTTYSADLLAIVQFSTLSAAVTNNRNHTMIPSISMAQPHTIERRIRALLDAGRSRRALSRRIVCSTLAVACAVLAPLAMAQVNAPAPPAPAAATADLSTPEATVNSFITALNRADLAAAAQCVQGAVNGTRPVLAARFEQGHPRFSISGLRLAIQGEKATVTIAEVTVTATASPKAAPVEDKMKEDELSLQREGGSWKIVPAKGKEFGRGPRPQMLEGIATMLTLSDAELSGYAQKAEQERCANNLKQLALAAHMYAEAHEGLLDFTTETASEALLPLLEGNNKLFVGTEGKSRLVFNGKLSKAKLGKIKDPAATVLFYEAVVGREAATAGANPAESGAVYFGYGGRANLAFADGHVQLVDQTEAAKLKWVP